MSRKNQHIVGGYIDNKEFAQLSMQLKSDNLNPSDFIRKCVKMYLRGELKMTNPGIKAQVIYYDDTTKEDVMSIEPPVTYPPVFSDTPAVE